MSFLSNLFSGGASTLVDSVGKVLDDVITNKEEKMQLENEIRKSELQFQVDMKKLSNEEQQMVLGDINSARQREIQVLNAPHVSWWTKNTQHIMALGTIVITLALFYVLIFTEDLIKEGKKEIILYILGVLSATLTQIYSYYFGSSSGSADKARTIAGMKGNP
jgi:hypothetical protein